jgi:hypothetical protein
MKQPLFPFLLVLLFLPSLACATFTPTSVTGSGEIVTQTVNVRNFDRVTLAASGDVYIEQGDTESLTIEADDNILPLLQARVRGDELILGMKPNLGLNPSQPIVYRLTVRDLNELSLNGSGNMDVEFVKTEDIKISIRGSGNITFQELTAKRVSLDLSGSGSIDIDELDASEVDTTMPGSGDITLNGKAEVQDVSINGSGNYLAGELETSLAEIRIPGSGDVTVWVLETLNTHVNGSGDIRYFGSPAVYENGMGSGHLTSLGDK